MGYRWFDDQQLTTRYHNAQRAEVARDWDQALTLYQSIPGYRDSDSRARDAGKVIAARDKNYAQAVNATDNKDWPAAFQAASNTNIAQPGYRNTQALLQQAKEQVYTEALSGTVALRTGGNQPGLYYRTSKGWVWLQGSDKYSEVRGLGPPGHVVYDIANSQLVLPQQNPTGGTPGKSSGPSVVQSIRKYMLASVHGDTLSFCQLSFNPQDYTFIVWGEHGAWGLHYNQPAFPFVGLGLRTSYFDYTIDYQAYDDPTIRKVVGPGTDLVVMDMAPSGDALLVAESVYASEADSATLNVYVTDPDATSRRLIFSGEEDLRSAHFSPDGRYVLLSTYEPSPGHQADKDAMVLVDLKTNSQHVLARQTISDDRYFLSPVVGATFLTQGAFRGKILLYHWSLSNMAFSMPAPESLLTLLDPADPDFPLAQAEAGTYPPGQVLVGEEEGGKCLVVAWQDGTDNSLPLAQTFTAFKMESGVPGVPVQFKLDAGEMLTGVSCTSGRMLYSTRAPGKSGSGTATVRSAELPGGGATDVGQEPELLFSGQAPGVPNYSFYSGWAAGPQMLAYVQDGELHARTYDGSIDIPLEEGVSNLYSFPYTSIHWIK